MKLLHLLAVFSHLLAFAFASPVDDLEVIFDDILEEDHMEILSQSDEPQKKKQKLDATQIYEEKHDEQRENLRSQPKECATERSLSRSELTA
uniref:Uncharacterized protein n=1 Tax=Ditylenchus dipsaci TaxID=166011 RepID=A0A915D5B6_9BILA